MAVIQGFVIPIIVQKPQFGQSFQVPHRFSRHETRRQHGGIGCDHDLVRQAAFESELGYAEGPVLIGLVGVQIPEGALRNPPWHPVLAAVGDLDGHGFPGGFVQQRVSIGTLEKKRHQIFKHRPGPTEQHPAPADGPVGPVHGKPMIDGNVSPGDGDKTSQPRFAGQEIVKSVVQPSFRDIETDRKQPVFGMIKKTHVDRCRKPAYRLPEPLALRQRFAGQPFRGIEGSQDAIDPVPDAVRMFRRFLPDGLERVYAGDVSVGQVPKRWGMLKGPAKNRQDVRIEPGDVIRRLLRQNFDPGEIAIGDISPGRELAQDLAGPTGRAFLCLCGRVGFCRQLPHVILRPAQPAERIGDPRRRGFPGAQQGIQGSNIKTAGFLIADNLPQDFTGVAQPGKGFSVENRRPYQSLEPGIKRPQGPQQIAAVHGGNVARFQRRQGLNVVPIEQMALMPLQFIDRLHRPCQFAGNLIHG